MAPKVTWLQDALENFLINYVIKRTQSRGDFPPDGHAYADITRIQDGFITVEWYHQRNTTDWSGSSRVCGETTISIPRALRMFMVSNDEEQQVCDGQIIH